VTDAEFVDERDGIAARCCRNEACRIREMIESEVGALLENLQPMSAKSIGFFEEGEGERSSTAELEKFNDIAVIRGFKNVKLFASREVGKRMVGEGRCGRGIG